MNFLRPGSLLAGMISIVLCNSLATANEDTDSYEKCRNLTGGVKNSETHSNKVRLSNIDYKTARIICANAYIKTVLNDHARFNDLKFRIARAGISSSFQLDKSIDGSGLKTLLELTVKGFCPAAIGLFRINEYISKLPYHIRTNVENTETQSQISIRINNLKTIENCPYLKSLLDIQKFVYEIVSHKSISIGFIESKFPNISKYFEGRHPDALFQTSMLFVRVLDLSDDKDASRAKLIADVLNEAASMGHLNSMISFYDLFQNSKNFELRVKAKEWLIKAIPYDSDGVLLRCYFEQSEHINKLRNHCYSSFSTNALKEEVAKINNKLGRNPLRQVTRSELIDGHTRLGILELSTPLMEW